jgi:hypothetical protein
MGGGGWILSSGMVNLLELPEESKFKNRLPKCD